LNLGQVEILQSQFRTNASVGAIGTDSGTGTDNPGGAASGGGIYIGTGTAIVSETSLIGNLAQAGNNSQGFGTGATPADGDGGAIFNNSGTLAITNSTIAQNQSIAGVHFPTGSGNAAGAGIYNSEGQLTLSFSTVAENTNYAGTNGIVLGDGIYNTGQAKLDNTIVAYHTHGNFAGTITDQGHNISSDDSAHFSSSLQNADPKLGPIADNGGPTLTMALLEGSPAIDSGASTGPAIDQRGIARPYGVGFDIGAFEQSAAPENISIQIQWVGQELQISIRGRPQRTYVLKSSVDFKSWRNVSSKLTDQDGKAQFQVDLEQDHEFFVVTE
jgi:hypothetical protein